jgi:hypothetical protein
MSLGLHYDRGARKRLQRGTWVVTGELDLGTWYVDHMGYERVRPNVR